MKDLGKASALMYGQDANFIGGVKASERMLESLFARKEEKSMNFIQLARNYATEGRYSKHLTEKRRSVAKLFKATYIVDTRYELQAGRLPLRIRMVMYSEGLKAIRIGSTTYRSSTWALIPSYTPDSEIYRA
jgi:hypothetical protein